MGFFFFFLVAKFWHQMRDESLKWDCEPIFVPIQAHTRTRLMYKNKIHVSSVYSACFIIVKNNFLCLSTGLNYTNVWGSVLWCSVLRSRPCFKWGPEGADSWTAEHVQRDFPHIMGCKTRCRKNRGCLLCWLTLHLLLPVDRHWLCIICSSIRTSSFLKQG